MLSPLKSSMLQYQQCHYRYQTLSSLGAGLDESSEGHEHAQEEWIRTVYQKKRLLSIKRSRASCGVGGTSHEIPHHSPEPARPSSNVSSDAD